MIPELLFNIAKCDNFLNLISSVNLHHPCNEIVHFQRSQGVVDSKDFQIPEPWSGDIINAPILIISSNPSFSNHEIYPTLSWPDSMIADFFINRFKDRGGKYSWVFDNKILNKDGSRSPSQKYWSSIKKRVEELIGRQAIPGIDYCITELVHCKSFQQIGVQSALPECSKLFFSGKNGISGAKIIIAIGSIVRDHFEEVNEINGIPTIYLPHPNAFERKTVPSHYSGEEIEIFREILNKAPTKEINVDYSETQLPTEEEVIEFIDYLITTHNNGYRS